MTVSGMMPSQPQLPHVDPPGYLEDCRTIFADELLGHRQTLQQYLQEWIHEQDGIFDRAIARLSLDLQEEASSTKFPAAADTACNLATRTPCDNVGVTSMPRSSDSPLTCDASQIQQTKSITQKSQDLGLHDFLDKRKDSRSISVVDAGPLGRSNSNPGSNPILYHVVHSKFFELLCGAVILANAVLLGVASDYAMKNLENPEHPVMSVIELGFCCFYFIEVCLRIVVFRCWYFKSFDWKWNWFDLALVVMSIWDQIEKRLDIPASAFENLSFLRLLRLMKMLKVLRMIRLMRMFRELRLILHSVIGCINAMFWAVVLIVATSYMFGICFLQGCTSYLMSNDHADLDADVSSGIYEYWSSLGTVMLSLYMAATAGKEWSAIARPLKSVGFVYYFIMLAYIAFFTFVVMNTVTSLFLESMITLAEKDTQLVIEREIEKSVSCVSKLADFYNEVDEDQDGQVSLEDFCRHMHREELRAFAHHLDIDVSDAKHFFNILSDNGRRTVNIDCFVVGCMQLKGTARSMDLIGLVHNQKRAQQDAQLIANQQLERVDSLEKLLLSHFATIQRDIVASRSGRTKVNSYPTNPCPAPVVLSPQRDLPSQQSGSGSDDGVDQLWDLTMLAQACAESDLQ